MVEWHLFNIGDFSLTWTEFVGWFESLPIYGQILFIVAIAGLLTLIAVGVYYLIKGVVYLVYYILKGVYYLIRAIFFALYKFFEELYYLISGKERPKKEESTKAPHTIIVKVQAPPTPIAKEDTISVVKFCSECGSVISESTAETLATRGIAFCAHCGKAFKAGYVEIES